MSGVCRKHREYGGGMLVWYALPKIKKLSHFTILGALIMYVVTNSQGEKFRGYDCGIMFWGYEDFLTFDQLKQAVSVAKIVNTAPYGKNVRHPQAKVEPFNP